MDVKLMSLTYCKGNGHTYIYSWVIGIACRSFGEELLIHPHSLKTTENYLSSHQWELQYESLAWNSKKQTSIMIREGVHHDWSWFLPGLKRFCFLTLNSSSLPYLRAWGLAFLSVLLHSCVAEKWFPFGRTISWELHKVNATELIE